MIRVFRHYVPKSMLLLAASEALILFGSVYVGVYAHTLEANPTAKLLVGELWPKGLLYVGLMLLIMSAIGLYQRGLRDGVRGLLFRIAVGFAVGYLAMLMILAVLPGFSVGANALLLTVAFALAGVVVFRTVLYRYLEAEMFKRRVLVLGSGSLAAHVDQLRRKSDWRDMVLAGYVPVGNESPRVAPSRVLLDRSEGPADSLLDLAIEHDVDEIVVAIDQRSEAFPLNEVVDCKMSGINIINLVTFFERATGKINVNALTLENIIYADGFVHAVLKGYVHRAFDVIASLALLSVAWPAMLACAAAIWFESGSPVLYRQVRVGRNNRPFEILKFRSMTVDAEKGGAQFAQRFDSRVTRVGQFIRKVRIDELPQLLNVLRGDMSFVGPRPERPEFVAELTRRIPYYNLRHRVNPGITGWAQISYPYGASEEDSKEKLQYDLYYIKNFSIFLDLMILLHTAQVVLWGKGGR